jgi:hypothetical protein
MLRYSLRTLLILLAVLPPLVALAFAEAKAGLNRYREQQRIKAWADFCVRTGWMISGELPDGMPPTQ